MSDQVEEQQHAVPPLTPVVRGVLVANAAALFLQFTIANPAGVARMFGVSSSAFPDRWWTAITFMFVHAGAWHLLANMYALWIFGPRLEHEWGTKKFGGFYLICALSAVVAQALFVRQGILTGSSAPIFGVMVAYAMQWPNDEFSMLSIPVKVWTLVTVFAAINMTLGLWGTGVDGAVNLAYLAHLGGFAGAWIYMRTPTGSMDHVQQKVAQLPEPGEPPRAIPKNGPRKERGEEVDEIVAKSKAVMAKKSPTLTQPRPRRADARPDELNRVLDKISKQGLDSLTAEERRLLEEASKRLRNG